MYLPSGISSSGGWQHFKWNPRSHPSQNNMLSLKCKTTTTAHALPFT